MPIIKELRAFYLPDSAKLGFSANRNETVGSTDVFHVLSKTAGNKNNETDAGNLGAADRAEEFEEVKA